jgi:exopolysaccharide biosynthesis WecB/TagA/CpsF family protein
MRAHIPTITVLGLPLARLDLPAALAEVERCHLEEAPALVAFANAHTLVLARHDAEYRKVLQRASLLLNDGAGVGLAARVQGRRFPANLNGSDFNLELLKLAARRHWRVFLLGARPGVAPRAAQRLTVKIRGLTIAGTQDGYFPAVETERVLATIRDSRADVLLVAMGNPLQELWLARHLPATGARLGLGVGAFLDFSAGAVRRAPAWMNRAGIEWLYRLAQEPRRLLRRYTVENAEFLWRIAAERLAGG